MALNPPIEALPIQETDRDGHLQRYLSGLPDFASWQDQGEGPVQEIERVGMDVQDREVEAAERRNERKIRRRQKAAILKPKPDPPEELDQEWWDNYRAQKQGLLLDKEIEPVQHRNTDMEIEAERGEMIMEKKENRRMQQRIPRSKGRGKGKGIPGMEIIEAYRPMTNALGPRMTMKPETKKGMFANGKSSTPGVINLLQSAKVGNPRVSSSQSTPGRLTMESPERDWRDQWRRKSSQPRPQSQTQVRQVNDKLPQPGYTNSTSWPSTLPSSDGPSKPSRSRIGQMEVIRRHSIDRSPGQDLARYMYRHPSLPPLQARRTQEAGPRITNYPRIHYPNYPFPHDPTSHDPSSHLHHSHEYHPQFQDSRFSDGRKIYVNQGQFSQDTRSHQPRTQDHQEHNPYPQAYSPLPPPHSHIHPLAPPHSHLCSHSLPSSSPYLHPDHHAQLHGNIPQTPIFQDRRNIDTHLGMNIPPPFSTPGPSRYPEEGQPFQSHLRAPPWGSYENTLSAQDNHLYQARPDEDIQEEGLEGFWKGRRPESGNGGEHDRHPMEVDHPPILDQYDHQPNHPALPPYYETQGLFIPEQHQHDPMNLYRHQHQLHHPDNTFPPQVYQTPQIEHYQYNEFERRYETPLPDHHQRNNHGAVLEDLREECRLEDLHEVDRGEDREEEIMEFGASTDEWKLLWSSRKAAN